jgi:RNA polymerase sigma factor CnrH
VVAKPADQNDSELATLALAGAADAHRTLLDRHRAGVYRLVRAQIDDADAALDIVQETFIAAFANLHRYDRHRPFRNWIMRIALNKCRDWQRRRKVRGFLFRARPLDEGLHVADHRPDPEAEAATRQDLVRTRKAIERLPDNLRSVLLLRTIEGLSQADTADLLGLSEKTVETRLYRARQKVVEFLRADQSASV